MAMRFKGAHFPKDVILTGVRWYVAYPLSTRHVEELLEERGVSVDHATMNRWVIKYSPQLAEAFHRRQRPVWISWCLDETYIRVKSEWKYLYETSTHQNLRQSRVSSLPYGVPCRLWGLQRGSPGLTP
jgi:transposase-like protein